MSISNTEKELETILPIGINIELYGEVFSIKPFVLKNRIKVLRLITDVFGELTQKMPNMQNTSQTALLSALIGIAGDRLIDVYEIVLNKDKEWLLENIQIKDEINIIKTIIEVNDFPLLLSQINQMITGKKD